MIEGEGYIRLYWKTKRSIVGDNPIAMGLWAHILLSCAVKRQLLLNGQILEPGECVVSATELAKQAGVSKTTMNNYLKSMADDGMIEVLNRGRNGTHLSVCNFRTYQPQFFGELPKGDRNETATKLKRNLNDPQTENPKKPKSPKKPNSRRFTPPTVEEVRQYCQERGNRVDPQKFINHYEAANWKRGKGTQITNWKACVRTWEGNDYERKQTLDNSTVAGNVGERGL